MKKIDLSKEILDRKGNRITAKVRIPSTKEIDNGETIEEEKYEYRVLSLGSALRDSVLQVSFDLGLDEKMYRYRLFEKIEKDDVIEFSDEEISRLKELVASRYEILYCGQIVDMLDSEE